VLTHQPAGLGMLERAATAGVAFLAAGSFALSYDALHQLAVANDVPKPLAWVWPLIIDGFIITASLAVLHAILTARSATYPWILVLAFSTTSVAFNILHAPPTVVARSVAAIPPLTLVLSFELLMRQLGDRLGPDVQSVRPAIATAFEQSATARSAHHGGPAAQQPGGAASLLDTTRRLAREHADAGIRLTGKTLGHLLGVSDGYARRLLRQAAGIANEQG
jgi:hypothetical protein